MSEQETSEKAVQDLYDITIECNSIAYVDQNNVQHQIYLPKGTAARARALFAAENWDELAKFPPYTGQGYTEDDYILTKKKVDPTGSKLS